MKTETQTQHTQGEWKAEKEFIVTQKGGVIAKTLAYTEDIDVPEHLLQEAYANARRIVKAVNMHDESIRLIKNSLIELQALGGDKDTRQLILKLIDFINDNNV